PLILEAGGVQPPPDTTGLERPVFAQLARGWGTPQTSPRSLLAVTWKGERLIAHLEQPDRVELYDLRADPGETRDLSAIRPEVLRELRALVFAHQANAKSPWGVPPPEVELDALRLNQLRALGYVVKP
ncbi:MAG: hypothetical protein OEY15_12350, partial [Myxococcales bacterium]|nr:hypothetical protein [Myxococcales bacterium]